MNLADLKCVQKRLLCESWRRHNFASFKPICSLNPPNSVKWAHLGLDPSSTSKRIQNIFYVSKMKRQMFDSQPLIIQGLCPTTVITLRGEMNLCSTSHYNCLSHHSMGRWRRPEASNPKNLINFERCGTRKSMFQKCSKLTKMASGDRFLH